MRLRRLRATTRYLLQRGLLILLPLLLVGAVAEVALRGVASTDLSFERDVVTQGEVAQARRRRPEQAFVWHGQPGNPREFVPVASTWNAAGFNDRQYSLQKDPAVVRAVVVGDSFVEALEVPQSKNFHKLLEESLNGNVAGQRYEVIGLGRSDTGPETYLQRLQEIGLAYQPDLVIFEFLAQNDVRNDSVELTRMYQAQKQKLSEISSRIYLPELYSPDSGWPAAFRESRFVSFLAQSLLNIKYKLDLTRLPFHEQVPIDLYVYKAQYDQNDPVDRAWQKGWDRTLATIARTRDLVESRGIRFMLVSFSDAWRLDARAIQALYDTYPTTRHLDLDFDKPEERLKTFAAAANIAYLDLLPGFRDAYQRTGTALHFEHDGHWTEAGHRLAAELIYARLVADGLAR
jgi:hypothetical protein